MRRPLCLLCLIYVLAVILILQWIPLKNERAGLPGEGSRFTLQGRVDRIEYQKDKSVLYLKNNSGKVVCYFRDISFVSTLKIGNEVCVTGKVRRFEAPSNEGQFDEKQYYEVLGIDFALWDCSGIITDESSNVYRQMLYRFRRRFSRGLAEGLPEKHAGIMQAMLLGEKGGMDTEIKELYRQNGIAHILAISGLHITFLGMGFFRLCRKIRMPAAVAGALSFALVVSYGEMTQSGASAVRSTVMFSLFLLGGIWGRTYDLLTAMAVSAAGLLFFQPLYIYHSGFLLSFCSVMGIALLAPLIREMFPAQAFPDRIILDKSRKEKILERFLEKLYASLSASLSVSLATLPVQLYFYYMFPPYSPLLNLLVVPFVGVLIFTGFAGGAAACLMPSGSAVFTMPCRWILEMYEAVCRIFDKLPGGHLVAGRPSLWKIFVYYGMLMAVLLWEIRKKEGERSRSHGKNKKAGAEGRAEKGKPNTIRETMVKTGILTVAVLLLCMGERRNTSSCTMLDIGQGDCFVIEEKKGCNILIDGGSSDISSVGKYRIAPYLRCRGISRLDYVFVSHGDKDHTSGVLELLSGGEIKIDCLVMTKFALEDEIYEELLEAAEESGTRILFIGKGDYFTMGEIRLTCLYPEMIDEGTGNDQSMVLLMECGGTRTLFTGDLTKEKEELTAFLDIDVLKVAHHGSKYSTGQAFLEQTTPAISLISAGCNNGYGHPHEELLNRLAKAGSLVYQTPENGAVTVKFEKGKIRVTAFR